MTFYVVQTMHKNFIIRTRYYEDVDAISTKGDRALDWSPGTDAAKAMGRYDIVPLLVYEVPLGPKWNFVSRTWRQKFGCWFSVDNREKHRTIDIRQMR